ncbi:DUF5777 family beta-barrel protein [Lentimicrobium sp. S6]|uniref:DUF5777 family beta-barrel protein n=1 Tax=Lentimicrobium sp. S6 TaxID=2735872 RepID=UPI001555F5EC|nr:DUF5777 family beta-barrel protein [Lentimicrobium sp. S6]NPD45447.1 porin [Lentimicrobium sp. S6]
MKRIVLFFGLMFFGLISSFAQDDLMDIFGEDETIDYTSATFKTTRLALGYSVENPVKNDMIFLISHHFGNINGGAYEFFGLDQATIRLGLEYGITDRLTVGYGRSSYNKTYDGYLKYKVLRQSKGLKKMPVTLNLVAGTSINTLKWENPDQENYFSSRMTYLFQAIVARKFNKNLSLQFMPSLVHKNLVATAKDHNDIFTIGAGGRYKFTKRTSINVEYHYVIPDQIHSYDYTNSLTIGFDIETGGHVFQLFFTNSVPINVTDFLTHTTDKWRNGDIYFGFNISRIFSFGGKKH